MLLQKNIVKSGLHLIYSACYNAELAFANETPPPLNNRVEISYELCMFSEMPNH